MDLLYILVDIFVHSSDLLMDISLIGGGGGGGGGLHNPENPSGYGLAEGGGGVVQSTLEIEALYYTI